jgi:hypothetical protein
MNNEARKAVREGENLVTLARKVPKLRSYLTLKADGQSNTLY